MTISKFPVVLGGRLLASLVAAVALSCGVVSAQQPASGPPLYDVELVIFRVLSAEATPEQWSQQAVMAGQQLEIPDEDPSPFDTASDAAAVATSASFPALPPAQFQLTAIEDTLRRSRNYRPLAHIGWTQPGFPRNAAQSLSIESLVPAASGLHGQVALSRGRFLHLTLDLAYGPASNAPGVPGQKFVLRQTRRMRSNERHYIDHPKFGVIAVITPTEE